MEIFRVSGEVSRPTFRKGRPTSIVGYVVAETIPHAVEIAQKDGWRVWSVEISPRNIFMGMDPDTHDPGFV